MRNWGFKLFSPVISGKRPILYGVKLAIGVVAIVLALGGTASITTGGEPFLPILEKAWENLKAWPGIKRQKLESLRMDLENAPRAKPTNMVLTQAPGGQGYLLIVHFGWSVSVCYLDQNLKVLDAFSEPAKNGFSLSWDPGVVVTLHKHPGTGMFYDVPLRVVVRDGKLLAIKVSTSRK